MTTPATKERTGKHDSDTNAPASPSKRRATTGGGPTLGRTPTVAMPLHRLPQVSTPDDPLEVEAEQVAQRVVAGQPGGPISSTGPPAASQRSESNHDTVFAWLQRVAVGEEEVQRVAVGEDEEVQRVAVGEDEEVQRVAVGEEDEEKVQALLQRLPDGSPAASSGLTSALDSPGPGAPIPASTRTAIEPRLGAGLGGVEVHTGPRAERAADDVQARAFTNRNHIFLNHGESPHDVSLMAHEATHVVQQGAAGDVHRQTGLGGDQVQRLAADIAEEMAAYARHIPGYTLFTLIVGVNPLTGERVERTPINLLEGLMGLVPFGTAIFDKLVELEIIQDAFAFVERQLATFDLSMSRLERVVEEAWDNVDLTPRFDFFEDNLNRLIQPFQRLLEDVRGFAASLVDAVVQLIKDAAISVAEELLAGSPAWTLIKKVLGHDPLKDEPVDATTVEILEDFLLLIGKEQELEQMRVRGTLQEAADWLDTQLATFQALLAQLGSLFAQAWEAIQPENLPNLIPNLRGLADQAIGFLQGVWTFATTVAAKVLELVKNALLGWLSEFAHEIPGFHLLTVILGRNPFTGERVPRTAENLIRGFITLLPGGNAVYDQLAETGVIGEAAARIEGAMSELGISWEMVVGLFRGIWESLSIDDLVDPIGAFTRIRDQFGEPISRLFAFIRVVVEEIFKLLLAAMNFPSDVIGNIVANAMQAYEDIKRDVVGFLLNMLAAVKAGFSRFFDNILDHLLGGLIDWLFRGLREAGIEPPSELTLETGLDLVLQVLGLTADRLWEKLAERIGQERVDQIRGAIDRLEGIWTFVADVQERGIVAVWEYIQGQLTNLWDTIIEQARNWIMERIINRVVARLLSMLDPTGVMAVVNSFMAFFDAINSAVEYAREILDIVDQYVATLAAVARGDIEPGAARLEQGLVSAIPVAIGFLANQVGLGNIGEKITEILGGLRALVDPALDWLLNQAERMLDALLRTLGFADEDDTEPDFDVSDHAAVARSAIETLQEAAVGEDHVALQSNLEQAAQQAELRFTSLLEPGIGLTVQFSPPAEDELGFSVVIAPNTVTATGAVPLTASDLGPGGAVEENDSVILVDEGIGARVQEVKSVISGQGDVGESYGIWVRYRDGRRFLPYKHHGTTWRLVPVPPAVPFHAFGGPGEGGEVRVDHAMLRSGTRAHIPESAYEASGYDPSGNTWNEAGHLVAAVLGGPGGWSSGNIVAMTKDANKRTWVGVEREVKEDIEDNLAVYDYAARPRYRPEQVPPHEIVISIARAFPPGVPLPAGLEEENEVDNTLP